MFKLQCQKSENSYTTSRENCLNLNQKTYIKVTNTNSQKSYEKLWKIHNQRNANEKYFFLAFQSGKDYF